MFSSKKHDRDKCGALRDLVPFIQFKKREKHPWRGVNFSTQKNGMIESEDNEVWKHTH